MQKWYVQCKFVTGLYLTDDPTVDIIYWKPKHRLLNKTWTLGSVCIVAWPLDQTSIPTCFDGELDRYIILTERLWSFKIKMV